MDHINGIKAAIAAAAGALTGLWGWLVISWVACTVLDYITGSAAAGKTEANR
ncbi:MAG: phage holin family protein [Lawsonibacter sp.]